MCLFITAFGILLESKLIFLFQLSPLSFTVNALISYLPAENSKVNMLTYYKDTSYDQNT